MDKRSRIFFICFFILVATTIGVSFCKYLIFQDYYIKVKVACNPKLESCFVSGRDEGMDDYSAIDINKDFNYYKIVKRRASVVASCGRDTMNCLALVCQKGDDCKEITCSDGIVPDGEYCSTIKDNN